MKEKVFTIIKQNLDRKSANQCFTSKTKQQHAPESRYLVKILHNRCNWQAKIWQKGINDDEQGTSYVKMAKKERS